MKRIGPGALLWLLSLHSSGAAAAAVDPRILDAIESVKAADYPGANSAVVIDSQSIVFQSDGQFSATVREARLVLTSEGMAEAASASLSYAKDSETMEVLSAQVIKRSGSVINVDPKDIQDVEQSGEANIYDPEGRAVKVTFPNLAVGDVGDLTYRLTRRQPTRPGYFNDSFAFQSTSPTLESSYEVDGPAAMPLTSALYHPERAPGLQVSKTSAGDRVPLASVAQAERIPPACRARVRTHGRDVRAPSDRRVCCRADRGFPEAAAPAKRNTRGLHKRLPAPAREGRVVAQRPR